MTSRKVFKKMIKAAIMKYFDRMTLEIDREYAVKGIPRRTVTRSKRARGGKKTAKAYWRKRNGERTTGQA